MAKKESNPKNQDEKEREKSNPKREDPAKAEETDIIPPDEQKTIVEMVMEDYRVGTLAYAEWIIQKEKDLQQIHAEKPSIIENLTKKEWMADRNLGLCPATLDVYQATLLSTCYNPDSIHFQATEENDINNKDNLEKFAKWAVSPAEMDLEPEADDFVSNRVSLGFSAFEIGWEVKWEWVDVRTPEHKDLKNKRRVTGYKVETEHRRFERAFIENIDDLDDLILPSYGKDIQKLSFVIRRIHIMLSDIEDMAKRKVITIAFGKKNEDVKKRLTTATRVAAQRESLRSKRAEAVGVTQTVDEDGRDFPLDVYKWFGYLTRDGKRERYRVLVEPITQTFLSAKPLRKIRRDNKYPFSAGSFRRVPGQIRGESLTKLIAPMINALNNTENQTADFQTITNLPFGFMKPEEGFTQSLYEIEPGKLYTTEGNPSETVYFPNIQRSLAWDANHKNFLLEMIERSTGAASYFLTNESKGATATRDTIVEQKGETKFGLWVKRIQKDIVEAINMAMVLYQDWAPSDLGKRVLGEDGKQIIHNMSINSLWGKYDARMVPDITSGSKAYRARLALWGFRELQQGSVWMSPQMNPRGNWLLTKHTMKDQGIDNPEYYLPPMPKMAMDDDEEAKGEFTRLMQGEEIEPPEGATPAVVRHLATHMRQKETEYSDLDKEYRTNFDDHLFRTIINYQKFMDQMIQQQQEMKIAATAAKNLDKLGIRPPAAGSGQGQGQVLPPAIAPGSGGPVNGL